MAATLEEILISVWRQALEEEARTVTVRARAFPCGGRAGRDYSKWIFSSGPPADNEKG